MENETEYQLNLDNRTKTILLGALLIMSGVGCFFLFILGYLANSSKIPAPTAATTGKVITYKPGFSTSDTTWESPQCTFAYRVNEKFYTTINTCGADIFPFAERLDDEVEIIYQTTNPSKATVNRQSFFNFVGILGIPFIAFGGLLIRKGKRMNADDNRGNLY